MISIVNFCCQGKTLRQKTRSKKRARKQQKPKAVAKPVVGQKVMVDKFNKEGIIETEPDKDGNIRVTIGAIHTQIHVSEISIKEEDKKAKQTITTSNLTKQLSMELDLRGMTFEEAEIKIEKYFDEALIAGVKNVRLIHGKGTGALRRKIRKMLDHHSLVKTHQLAPQNLGGSGATEVTLIE